MDLNGETLLAVTILGIIFMNGKSLAADEGSSVFTFCKTGNQTVTATSSGLILSPPSDRLAGDFTQRTCLLTLKVRPPFLMEFKVAGDFQLPSEVKNNRECSHLNSLWIEHDDFEGRECGYKENGSILWTLEDSADDSQLSTITIGLTQGSTSDKETTFAISYTAQTPIDYGGVDQHAVYQAQSEGYIVSHIGGKSYWSQINSSLVLTGLKPGSEVMIRILKNDLGSTSSCGDYLLITDAMQQDKICGLEGLAVTTINVTGSTLTFNFITGFDFKQNGEGFLLFYQVISNITNSRSSTVLQQTTTVASMTASTNRIPVTTTNHTHTSRHNATGRPWTATAISETKTTSSLLTTNPTTATTATTTIATKTIPMTTMPMTTLRTRTTISAAMTTSDNMGAIATTHTVNISGTTSAHTIDQDDCKIEELCSPLAICVDTLKGSRCRCTAGFEGDGTTCSDIDECKNLNACETDQECFNTHGSYICAPNLDDCKTEELCSPLAFCVDTLKGSRCRCTTGFEGDGTTCSDIDECKNLNACETDQKCFNTQGSYICAPNLGATTVMCETHQSVIRASSYGFIQSPNYPSTSPNFRGPPCTVTLIAAGPSSIEVKVEGRFFIPPEYGSNQRCCFLSHSTTCLSVYETDEHSGACGNWNNGTGRWIKNNLLSGGSNSVDITVSFKSIYDAFSFRLNYKVKWPIDFGGTNQHTEYEALPLGFIISHLDGPNYRNNINSTLTITRVQPGTTATLYILSKDLRNQQTCDDHLIIAGGIADVKICGSERRQIWEVELISSRMTFTFVTDSQFVGEGFELEYYVTLSSSPYDGPVVGAVPISAEPHIIPTRDTETVEADVITTASGQSSYPPPVTVSAIVIASALPSSVIIVIAIIAAVVVLCKHKKNRKSSQTSSDIHLREINQDPVTTVNNMSTSQRQPNSSNHHKHVQREDEYDQIPADYFERERVCAYASYSLPPCSGTYVRGAYEVRAE